MRQHYLITTAFIVLSAFFITDMVSNSGGSPSGRTGSPVDNGTCASAGCHASFALDSGPAEATLSTDIPKEGYMPGATYTVTVTAKEIGKRRFGFQAMALGTNSGTGSGDVTITDATRTKLNPFTPGNPQYVTHTNQGIDDTDSIEWSYDWTAPMAGEGEVIIYSTINVSNRNGNAAGDHIYSRRDTLQELDNTALDQLRDIAEARLYPNPASDQVFMELEILQPFSLTAKVLNMQGQVVWSLEDEVFAGMYQSSFNVKGWAPGMYLLSLEDGYNKSYQKLVVK